MMGFWMSLSSLSPSFVGLEELLGEDVAQWIQSGGICALSGDGSLGFCVIVER